MSNNNWHVPLNRFNDEQRKVIDRVYGRKDEEVFLVSGDDGVMPYQSYPPGEEIPADEAFKILGLDRLLDTDLVTVNNLKAQNKALHQELAELEQQLANQSEQGLQGVDWDSAPYGSEKLAQFGVLVTWLKEGHYYRISEDSWAYAETKDFEILATRPKPKVKPLTDDQIEAVREFVSDYDWAVKQETVDKWLKERES